MFYPSRLLTKKKSQRTSSQLIDLLKYLYYATVRIANDTGSGKVIEEDIILKKIPNILIDLFTVIKESEVSLFETTCSTLLRNGQNVYKTKARSQITQILILKF